MKTSASSTDWQTTKKVANFWTPTTTVACRKLKISSARSLANLFMLMERDRSLIEASICDGGSAMRNNWSCQLIFLDRPSIHSLSGRTMKRAGRCNTEDHLAKVFFMCSSFVIPEHILALLVLLSNVFQSNFKLVLFYTEKIVLFFSE